MRENPIAPSGPAQQGSRLGGSLHPLRDLQREIGHWLDVMYEKIGKHHHAVSGHVATDFSPDTDVSESKECLHIALELPGVAEDDIEILITEDRLTIRGEKRAEREVSEPGYHLQERAYGRFERSFWLPPGVEGEKAKAHFEDGVLTVDVPTAPDARKAGRKVPIRSR